MVDGYSCETPCAMNEVLAAAFWGVVGGLALVLGALITLRAPLSPRAVGLIMAFGSGF